MDWRRLQQSPGLFALAFALLLSVAALGWARRAPVARFEESEAWRAAEAAEYDFGLDDDIGVLAVFGPVLAPENEPALRELERSLEALRELRAVVTPWDVPGLADRSLAQAAPHPLVEGTLVDRERRGLMLPLRWEPDPPPRSDEEEAAADTSTGFGNAEAWFERIRATAQAALDTAPPPRTEADALVAGVTGIRALVTAQSRAFGRERWRFQLLGALFGFALACIAFRDVRATLLAGLPPLFGVGVSLGVTRLCGLGATGFTSIVLPLLVLTIGFTDSLHIVVGAARARRAGAANGWEAAQRSLRELFRPCALTSLTTAIGFASLALASNPLVHDFGLSCALATALSFVCVVLAIPLLAWTPLGAALDRVKPPSFDEHPPRGASDLEADLAPGRRPALPARAVDAVLRVTLRAPRRVAAAALAATLALAACASTLEIDRRASSDLADGGAAARTLARVDRELGGAFPLQVRLDWDESVGGATVLAAARAVREVLAGEPLVTAALGPDLLARALGPANATGAPAQHNAAQDGVAWAALRVAPREWSRAVIDVEARRALVHARVPDAGSRVLVPAFQRLREALATRVPAGVHATLVGSHLAYLETVTEVARDLAQSLALAAVLILVTLALAFRSWRLGLAAVVPNLFPLTASAAGLALLGGRVDISTLTALTLSLGIATDDTIHVLARWRQARREGLAPRDAAHAAVLRTLPAIALTTLTLTAAFAQLLTSELPTIRSFGLLAATTLAAAFAADVWMLPAFLIVLGTARAAR